MGRYAITLVVAIVAIGYLGREPLLQAAGDFLAVSDPVRPVDAALVIGGDVFERLATSRRLLQDGYGQWLVISGGPYGRGLNSAVTMRHQALASGVPAGRILVDDTSESTVDNAEMTARLMASHGLRTGVVLTSPYHTRRAGVVFFRVFRRTGLLVRVLAVDDGHFRLELWWTRPNDRRLVVREYLKLAAFLGGAR